MLGILGIVVIIVAAVLAFRTAKQYGRKAGLWLALVLGVGFGIQMVVPFVIVIVVSVVMLMQGSTQQEIQVALEGWAIVINVVFIFLSVVAVMWILKYLSNVPEEAPFTAPPAPPESFN